MKIIAKTQDGWLLEATDSDIATLQGLSQVDKRFKRPNPGDEFEISEIYDTLANLNYDTDIRQLQYASENLDKLSKWLKVYKDKHRDKAKDLKYQDRDH